MAEQPRFDPAREGDDLDQVLDLGLALGFGEDDEADASRGDTVLSLLRRRSGLTPQVMLRDLHDATSPPVDPHSLEARAAAAGSDDRYQILGEIAHGGVGVVLKGRDTDLGRDLAMKVLLEQHAADPAMLKRFVEEAQIGGQLQHPGVVPVYDMGLGADRRPYFTMKLVQGQTLKAMLEARHDAPADRRRFLGIFEKVLETMAYAHARGVIHRDLKPSNIMVGPYGEVQVMDWGLAKVLARADAPESAAPARAPAGDEDRVETIRSGADDSRSETGSIMGTPAFMPPEQARGEVERLDERSDVFSLGAILCHILTGSPPYTGGSPRAIRDRAAAADLGEALVRLDEAAIDPDLVAITHRCLATEPEARPRNAAEVAETFAAYLASVDERVQTAEVAAAEARGKAAEERRARRVTTTLSAALILALLAVAAIFIWNERARSDRRESANRQADRALRDARLVRAEAEGSDAADVVRWARALESAKRAHALATGDDVAETTRTDAGAFLAEVEAAEQAARAVAAQAAADRKLVRCLEEARLASAESWDMPGEFEAEAERHYVEAFRDHGFDFEKATVEELSHAIRGSGVRRAIVGALLDWGEVRQRIARRNADDADALAAVKKVEAVLTAVAPDPVMIRMRDAFRRKDVKTLREVGDSDDVLTLPVAALEWLGNALAQHGDVDGAIAFLSRAQRAHPGDYWINHVLGYWAGRARPPRLETAARSHQAAAAIRPDSPSAWSSLGFVLLKQGSFEEAERAFRRALEARADFASAHFGLGQASAKRGRTEAAVAAFEAGFRLRPESAAGRVNYARMLLGVGKTDEAIGQMRRAVEQHEDVAEVHYNLGVALAAAGRRKEAEADYRRTIELDPKHAQAWNNLGAVLADTGRYDDAVAAFEKSIEADPTLPNPHLNLAREFIRRGQSDPAEAALERAIQLKPDWGEAYGLLGQVYFRQNRNARALAAAREATRCEPDSASHHNLLAKSLDRLGKTDEAVAAAKRAIELDPESGQAYYTLSVVLLGENDVAEALKALRSAVRINPGFTLAHLNIGYIFMQSGRRDEALVAFRKSVEADPAFADGWVNMGAVLERKRDYIGAIAAYRKGIEAAPRHAVAHGNLGVSLRRLGRWPEAVAAFRKSIELDPSEAGHHLSLGHALHQVGKLDEAKATVREAIGRSPRRADCHYVLGDIFLHDGARLADAASEYRETIRLQADHIGAHFKLGAMLVSLGEYREALTVLKRGRGLVVDRGMSTTVYDEWIAKAKRRIQMEARLPDVVANGESVPPGDRIDLARVAAERGRHDVAVRLWRLVFDTDAAEAQGDADRYEAATAAVRAAAKPAAFGGTDSGAERAEWRKEALAWLRAEIGARVEAGREKTDAAQVVLRLQRFCLWKRDRSLAPVRDAERLEQLTNDEREAWRSFWEKLDRAIEDTRQQLGAPD